MCIDFRILNNVTLKNRYFLFFIDMLLDAVAGKEMFLFCDGYVRFYRIFMYSDSVLKIIFITSRIFVYTVMLFGLEGGSGRY